MDQTLTTYSESIVLSLCKEIEYIKIRSKNINRSLKTCQNETLTKRLKLELERLNRNKLRIPGPLIQFIPNKISPERNSIIIASMMETIASLRGSDE